MSNKKFISYFHMLYTGLKGTAGAYMAALLVLLSAFAATGAEKTPTTDANRQALPIKASVKKVPETTKKLQDSSTQPSVASTQPKVASIVILNNTGLPDSEIFIKLNNTVGATDTTCYQLQLDMNAMFQWYGGTANKPAVQIMNDHYLQNWAGTAISLADMRGLVASNATAASPTPTNSNTYWSTQKYAELVPNNPDVLNVPDGQFPTISLGLWGAQSEILTTTTPSTTCKYPGQMAIYVSENANTTFIAYKNTTCGAYQPYVLLEGSIFPSDQADTTAITFSYTGPSDAYNSDNNDKQVNVPKIFPKNASNFDLSYVDQFSMGANFELWGLKGNSAYKVMPATAYQSGQALQMPKTCFSSFVSNKPSLAQFDYSELSHNFYNFPAQQYSGEPCTPPNTYTDWINELVGLSQTQPNAPVLKVKSYPTPNNPSNYYVGGGVFYAFNDPPYGQALEYNFAAYFVDLNVNGVGGWQTILNNYKSDTGDSVALPAGLAPPTGLDLKKRYMLMLGKFSNGSKEQSLVNKSNDPPPSGYNYPVSTGPGSGPVSVQFDKSSDILMNMTGVITITCTPDIQTTGVPGPSNPPPTTCDCELGSMFTIKCTKDTTNCNIVTSESNGLLGINFSMLQDNFTLKEFDLAAGLTANAAADADGTLQVSLVQVGPNNGLTLLNKIVLTLPKNTLNVGLARDVIGTDAKFGSMPLSINWQNGTCTFNKSPLNNTKFYLPNTSGGGWSATPIDSSSADWKTWQTNLNLKHFSSDQNGYRIFLKGDNMTVALSSANLTGSNLAPVIVPYIPNLQDPNNFNKYFIYKAGVGTDLHNLCCTNNKDLACTITVAPTANATTTDLHLLAVAIDGTTDNLNTFIANSNPKYRFFRYETSAWTEATKASTDPTNPWPISPNTSGITTTGIVNDVTGRIAGDAVTAFTFGIVNSQKLGSAFNLTWPTAPDATNFPAQSTTKIGDLTTCQYFYLMKLQPSNNGTLPVGANLNNDLSKIRYDPYNDVGMNKLSSNGYFFGFTDRIGGLFNPNPTFNMDSGTDVQAKLGFVPGSLSPTQPVIVITLHPIDQVPSTMTIMHDVNQSGSTDSEDLSLVLLAIGVCPPAPQTCPEDLNKDGVVDNTDVGLVLLHFGL